MTSLQALQELFPRLHQAVPGPITALQGLRGEGLVEGRVWEEAGLLLGRAVRGARGRNKGRAPSVCKYPFVALLPSLYFFLYNTFYKQGTH